MLLVPHRLTELNSHGRCSPVGTVPIATEWLFAAKQALETESAPWDPINSHIICYLRAILLTGTSSSLISNQPAAVTHLRSFRIFPWLSLLFVRLLTNMLIICILSLHEKSRLGPLS